MILLFSLTKLLSFISLIQLDISLKLSLFVVSKSTKIPSEFWLYFFGKHLNLSCPAVLHIVNLYSSFKIFIFFASLSIPIVERNLSSNSFLQYVFIKLFFPTDVSPINIKLKELEEFENPFIIFCATNTLFIGGSFVDSFIIVFNFLISSLILFPFFIDIFILSIEVLLHSKNSLISNSDISLIFSWSNLFITKIILR